MTDLDAGILREHPEWQLVLSAYWRLQQTLFNQTNDGERWIPRLTHVEGVPDEKLAAIHGKLIALGWLQFELQGTDQGVVYRVSQEGQSALQAFMRQQTSQASEVCSEIYKGAEQTCPH